MELFTRTRTVIVDKPPLVQIEKKFNKTKLKLAKTITTEMTNYKSLQIKDEKLFSTLSVDMAIPNDSLK